MYILFILLKPHYIYISKVLAFSVGCAKMSLTPVLVLTLLCMAMTVSERIYANNFGLTMSLF